MLAIPWMVRDAGPRRVVRGKLWSLRQYGSSMRAHPIQAINFVLLDPELDNFTYDIANVDELRDFLASQLRVEKDVVSGYIRELEGDTAFRNQLNATLRTRRDRKSVAKYGRRIGWYCIVRITHPQVVIETGVHDGLGSSVLLQALSRNRAEGHDGQLFGIDINPKAGWLIPERLRDHMTLLIEDSATAVPRIARENGIDVFLHDSDHRYQHEFQEFQTAAEGMRPGGIFMSDNSHATTALKDYAASVGREYAFWQERPKNHFYPGAGIGISVRPK